MKPIKMLLLSSAILNLSACTFFDDTSVGTLRQEYLGWYCETDIAVSDQWHCSKRLMSDALPIDKVSQPLQKAPQLKQKVPQRIQKVPQSLEVPQLMKAPQPVETPPEKIVEQPERDLFPSFDISADGYTVQLGAYLSQAMAEQSAEKIITDGGQLVVQSIIVGGQYRFVIVQGQYSTRLQAQTAAEGLTALNPQLEYWVRSIESLRNSL